MVHSLMTKVSGLHRRKRGQLGKMQAMVATAHKLARTVYHMLKYKTPYRELNAETYEAQ
jgi:transposase